MTTNIEPLMTIADWEAMPDDGNRYEIIEGELFASRSPGLTDQIVLGNLVFLIRSYLEQNPIGMVVFTPGLILSEYSGVIPDIVFFSHLRAGNIISGERLTGPPEQDLQASTQKLRAVANAVLSDPSGEDTHDYVETDCCTVFAFGINDDCTCRTEETDSKDRRRS